VDVYWITIFGPFTIHINTHGLTLHIIRILQIGVDDSGLFRENQQAVYLDYYGK
jgi:hypothetical protein